jgi:hypothetical protein
MPVVVVSEGTTDAGDFDSSEREGSVRVLIRRVLEEKLGTALASERFVRRPWARVHKVDVRTTSGFQVKLAKTIEFYQKTMPDCDGIAVVVDRDHLRHASKLEKLQAGREQARSDGFGLADQTALGLAVEEVEAWLLADHDYWNGVLKRSKAFGNPEEIPKPKEVYRKALEELGHVPDECYDRIAAEASLAKIRERCEAFDAFAQEVEQRIEITP